MRPIINAKVEYKPNLHNIAQVAVKCPQCGGWFDGNDISNVGKHLGIESNYDLWSAYFNCPLCDIWLDITAATQIEQVTNDQFKKIPIRRPTIT